MHVNGSPKLGRSPMSGIDVLVVGGGIGGLFAAVELHRKGHSVRVIESKERIEGIGQPNFLHYLR